MQPNKKVVKYLKDYLHFLLAGHDEQWLHLKALIERT